MDFYGNFQLLMLFPQNKSQFYNNNPIKYCKYLKGIILILKLILKLCRTCEKQKHLKRLFTVY